MTSNVDLRELAIDRGDGITAQRQMLTRYVLPATIIIGFLTLMAWSVRDYLWPPMEVRVLPVSATTELTLEEGTPLFQAAGWVEPRPTPLRVAALAPGVVEKLLVVEDQVLQRGDKIAELVKDDARLAHDRALADLKLRQAELQQAVAEEQAAETRLSQPVHLETSLREAEASLAKIDTDLKTLPFDIRRAQADSSAMQKDYQGKLAARKFVSGTALDIARSKHESALELVAQLKARLNALEKERDALVLRRDAWKKQLSLLADELKARDQSRAKVSAAKARIEQARVAVAEAKLRLLRMTVVAPVGGRVFRLIAHPGARIGAGMTQMDGYDGSTVVTMYQPQRLQIRVDVRFEDIPKVSLNQRVRIANPALAQPVDGVVLFVSSEADIQKNTLQVKVGLPKPPSVCKPDMLMDVTFLAAKPQQPKGPTTEVRLYVLKQLIQQDEKGAFVWVADRSDGVARRTPIKTGRVGSYGLVEVTRGLTATSRVIASPTESLRDGRRIVVVGEDESR